MLFEKWLCYFSYSSFRLCKYDFRGNSFSTNGTCGMVRCFCTEGLRLSGVLLAGVVGAEGRVGLEARVSVQAVRGGRGGCQGPASPCFSLYSPSNSEGLLLLCSRTNGTTLARPVRPRDKFWSGSSSFPGTGLEACPMLGLG